MTPSRRRWIVSTGVVLLAGLAAGCGSTTVQVDSTKGSQESVLPPLTVPAGTEFALLPGAGAREFGGTPTEWTATSLHGDGFAVSMDGLPTAPMPRDEARQFLQVGPSPDLAVEEQHKRTGYVAETLVSLPVAWWEKAVADPDEHLVFDTATFTLGPLGEVTRTIEGSLAVGIRYSFASGRGRWESPVCSTCDNPISFGFSAAVGDRYISIHRVPSNITEMDVDLPYWAIDDEVVSETLVLVEFETEDQEGSMSWVDPNGEKRRQQVLVSFD